MWAALASARGVAAVALLCLTFAASGTAQNTYVYLNEYGADNRNNDFCDIEDQWTHLTISRLVNGCHLFKSKDSGNEFYTDYIHAPSHKNGTFPAVQFLGLFCSSSCDTCAVTYPQPNDVVLYGQCMAERTIGSLALYPSQYFCEGSPMLKPDPTGGDEVLIYSYQQPQCTMESDDDANNVLHIRNYGELSGQCVQDGTHNTYFNLNMETAADGTVSFNGVYKCDDGKCSQGCTTIDKVVEGEDFNPATGSPLAGTCIKMYRKKEILSKCQQVPQERPVGPAPPPGPPPPNDELAEDPGLVAGLVGGGAAIAGIMFTIAFCYRRHTGDGVGRGGYETRDPERIPASYSSASRPTSSYDYGTLTNDEEGMTTDI